VRLKNGLYALSSSIPGVSPLHEFQVAMALAQPAAISHWSALNYHGMTEQIPQRVFVLTTAQSLPRLRGTKAIHAGQGYTVGSTNYQFVKIKPEYFFGIEEVWINESKIKMTDIERTFLDCLMFPKYCGGFSEILYAFEQYTSKLNLEKIIRYALKLDTATIKRLGWILEQQRIALAKLTVLQKIPIKGYRLLDPTGPHKGKCNPYWMIQENLPGKMK
jgi:predicted transcriptional regulator of viral defense system